MLLAQYIKIVFIIFVFLLFSACLFRGPVDVIVADHEIMLDEQGTEIQCNPPLMRIRRNGSLQIKIKEEWDAEPPWHQIILESGKAVTITVVLNAGDGRQYIPSTIGMASGHDEKFISIRFNPQIPQNAEIKSILLKASSPISVENISWRNFDPL